MNEAETKEFKRGSLDCMVGIDHKEGQSEAYDRGYAARYELEQKQGATSSE